MLSRRAFGGALVGGAAFLAGCGNGESGGESGIPGYDPDGDVVAVGVTSGTPPPEVRLNEYALSLRGEALRGPFRQLVLPSAVPTGEYFASDHSWAVDGTDVTVPTVVADYEVADDHVEYAFDDRLSYWNDEPIDARAYYLADRLRLLAFGDDDATFEGEQVDETTYRQPLPDDAGPDTVRRQIHPGSVPLPPSFTEPWVDEFDGASSQDEADALYEELNSETVDFGTLAEEGYGAGAYRIESEDDVYNEGLVATLREDHPGDATVPNLVVRAVTSRQELNAEASLVENGTLDVGSGIIAESGGDFQPNSVPEGVTQLGVEPTPRRQGDQLFVNWDRPHVGRLWVRRAVVAAMPLDDAIGNRHGQRRRPIGQHTGMLSAAARAALGGDFVDSLHEYPIERDTETAGEWLRTAGYSRQDGQWVDLDGEPVAIGILQSAGSPDTLVESLADGLESFGIAVETASERVTPENDYAAAIRDGSWDLTVGPSPSGPTPAAYYGAAPGIQRGAVFGPPTGVAGNPLDACGDGDAWLTHPVEATVPDEPGALRVDGASYDDGGATYRHDGGTDVSVCDAVATVGSRDASADERREAARLCARWYNYALPSVVFSQPRHGVYGNTGAFSFPSADAGGTHVAEPDGAPEQYHVQAGTVR